MKNDKTSQLLDELNDLRGLKPGDVGYLAYIDMDGTFGETLRVYEVTNYELGFRLSALDSASPRERYANIRKAILRERERQRMAYNSMLKALKNLLADPSLAHPIYATCLAEARAAVAKATA